MKSYAFPGYHYELSHLSRDDVSLVNIAHTLAGTARFGAQQKDRVSVAQHCVEAVDRLNDGPLVKFYCLLHDAAEAFLGDIRRPVKRDLFIRHDGALCHVEEFELWVLDEIHAAFGLPPITDGILADVAAVDNVMLVTETRDLFIDRPERPSLECLDPAPPASNRPICDVMNYGKAFDSYMILALALLGEVHDIDAMTDGTLGRRVAWEWRQWIENDDVNWPRDFLELTEWYTE